MNTHASTARGAGLRQYTAVRTMRTARLFAWACWAGICSYPPLAIAADPTAQPPRAALVIGNADYAHVKRLKNPLNDAHDICDALGKLAYRVVCVTDIQTRQEFRARIQDFAETLTQNTAVLVYYAGHAIQLQGESYLVPTGAALRSETDVAHEGLEVGYLLDQISQAGAYVNIVILDACRNNPWAGMLRSAASGLGNITEIPLNTELFYATGANDSADDGQGRNGTLTKHLLARIQSDGGETEQDLFKLVNADVQSDSRAASGHLQVPELHANFNGQFCFKPCIQRVSRDELDKADAKVKELERRVAAGDPEAKAALDAAKADARQLKAQIEKEKKDAERKEREGRVKAFVPPTF